MMISALASYYDQLLREYPDKVARPGWTTCAVNNILVLSESGSLVRIVPMGDKHGTPKVVPAQAKKTSGVKADFLCDKAAYFFGIDPKMDSKRSRKCFEASKARHHEILDGVSSSVASAITAYFDTWDPDDTVAIQRLGSVFIDACEKGKLTFALLTPDGCLQNAEEDRKISEAWDAFNANDFEDDTPMVCLATGRETVPAKLHPSIKGIVGANSAGASLVSFNAPAFESYGHDGEQGRNAPVGEKTAQAYGLALNQLLSDPSHRLRIGDTTVVFWSERADQENTDLFSMLLGGVPSGEAKRDATDIDRDLAAILSELHSGKRVDLGGVDLDATFYVLGLAPNNARLSVRYFLKDGFGSMLKNVEDHYHRIEVAHGPGERSVLTPYWLLRSVENREASNPIVTSELAPPFIRAILGGGRYPESLYSNVLLRIKANRDVTYAQAAIIKGYLIRNCGRSEDEVTVELNEGRNDVAYNLGRAFSYLGQIQEAANGKDTLTGRYLDSACSRPAIVFPMLLKLSNDHLRKLSREKPGLAISLEKGLVEVLSGDRVGAFPKQLSLVEQGDFMLGYYHQKAARYQKKIDDADIKSANEPKEA